MIKQIKDWYNKNFNTPAQQLEKAERKKHRQEWDMKLAKERAKILEEKRFYDKKNRLEAELERSKNRKPTGSGAEGLRSWAEDFQKKSEKHSEELWSPYK